MKVIDHEPQTWFLLDDSGKLLLLAFCDYSFVSYEVLLALSPDEQSIFKERGHEYLNWLAQDINNSVPALKVSTSQYKARAQSPSRREAANSAIAAWRASESA
jgi:hypothetical protein